MSNDIRVTLKRGRSKPLWVGHPWVFSGAISKVDGNVGDTGGACLVLDERNNVVGSGFYNPHGRIAVRILEHRRTTDRVFTPQAFGTLLKTRVRAAVERRESLGLVGGGNTVYRLINAEGDLLPGLVVDRLGPAVGVHLNSRAMYEQRDLVVAALREVIDVDRVVVTVTETASRLEAIPVMSELVAGSHGVVGTGAVEVVENGVRYSLDLETSQKTGFYADQRDNRARFAALCGGKRVLDAYSYVGGFGLNAAKAGAEQVTCVDSSGPAIAQVTANAKLNGLASSVRPVREDAMNWLKEAKASHVRFDRVIIDPPKFARGRSHVNDALKKYARVNTLAMGALESGGLLLTCSCSQHVSAQDFARMLTDAGHRLRRSVQIFETWSQPADHPTVSVAPEGRYLKAFLVGVA